MMSFVTALMLFCVYMGHASMAAENRTSVQVHEKQLHNGNIRYQYQIVNAPCAVVNFSIGVYATKANADEGELNLAPLQVRSPTGWDGGVYAPENGGKAHISWIKDNYSINQIGSSLTGFEVVAPPAEQAYLKGHWRLGCLKSHAPSIRGQIVLH
ncbi:MAG: hypothetical protein JOZ57_08835 [Abitibacteriaceae bacterium]|nr:hypothetical protein [Abditibacteriaceae bacterium]